MPRLEDSWEEDDLLTHRRRRPPGRTGYALAEAGSRLLGWSGRPLAAAQCVALLYIWQLEGEERFAEPGDLAAASSHRRALATARAVAIYDELGAEFVDQVSHQTIDPAEVHVLREQLRALDDG